MLGTAAGDSRETLDAWQGFAYDVVEQKRKERKMSGRQRQQATGRAEQVPLRMVLTGKAGAGKSKTVRAIAVGERAAAFRELESVAAAAGGERRVQGGRCGDAADAGLSMRGEMAVEQRARDQRVEQAEKTCVLAAPTGCASFQMKYGAMTVHRAFGVMPGFLGASNTSGEGFMQRQRRLMAARPPALLAGKTVQS